MEDKQESLVSSSSIGNYSYLAVFSSPEQDEELLPPACKPFIAYYSPQQCNDTDISFQDSTEGAFVAGCKIFIRTMKTDGAETCCLNAEEESLFYTASELCVTVQVHSAEDESTAADTAADTNVAAEIVNATADTSTADVTTDIMNSTENKITITDDASKGLKTAADMRRVQDPSATVHVSSACYIFPKGRQVSMSDAASTLAGNPECQASIQETNQHSQNLVQNY